MFNKVICFGDIHFGEKQNSPVHNQDCIDFLKWMIGVAKEQGIKDCIFLGDWHHDRYRVSVSTLQYSSEGLSLLNDYFDNIWFIEGNHDLLHRQRRDVSSIGFVNGYSNITLIDEKTIFETDDGDVALVPWLIGEEWKELKGAEYKYVFGHFELPTFLLNALVRKPEKGNELNKEALANCGYVFSGHFHKRQIQGNIHYISSPFGHNFNDVDDKERGCMTLEWGGEPVYHDWPDAPIYRRWDIADLMENPEEVIGDDKNIYAEIFYTDDISYTQASYYKEELEEKFSFRKIILKGIKTKDNSEGEEITAKTVQSVDSIVIEQLQTIDSKTYDNDLLIEEYQALDTYGK